MTNYTTGLQAAQGNLAGFRGARGAFQLQSATTQYGDFGLGYWLPGSETTVIPLGENNEPIGPAVSSGSSPRTWVFNSNGPPIPWSAIAWRMVGLVGMYNNAMRRPGLVEKAADALGVDPSIVQMGLATADAAKGAAAVKFVGDIARTGYQYRYVAMGNGLGGVGVASGYTLTGTAQFGMLGLSFLGGYAFGSAIDHGLQAADICPGCGFYDATHHADGTYKPPHITDGGADWTRKR